MDIKQLGHSLSQKIVQSQRKSREQRLGIRQFEPTCFTFTNNNISKLIQTTVIEPIIKELGRTVEQTITYQCGTSIGFYYLLADNKKFAILYTPNPATGRFFMKRLNSKGMQCAAQELINNTCQITDYLKEFNAPCDQ